MKKIIDTVILPLASMGLAFGVAKLVQHKPILLMAILSILLHFASYYLTTKINKPKYATYLLLPNIVANVYLILEIVFKHFNAITVLPLVSEISAVTIATCLFYRFLLNIKVASAVAYASLSLLFIVAVAYAKTEKIILVSYALLFLYGALAIVHGNNALKLSKEDSYGKALHFIGATTILSIPLLNVYALSSTHLLAVLNNIPVYYSIMMLWAYLSLQIKSKYLIYPAIIFLCFPLAKINPIFGIILLLGLFTIIELAWDKVVYKIFND